MGTVIELNNHRLMNGDATSKSDVAELIGDCKVNLLLTDPPYGIDIVKIGGGKLVDKADTQLDHSREREREHLASIGGAKPPTFNKSKREREQMGTVGTPARPAFKMGGANCLW